MVTKMGVSTIIHDMYNYTGWIIYCDGIISCVDKMATYTRTIVNDIPELHSTARQYLFSVIHPIEQQLRQLRDYDALVTYIRNEYYETLVPLLLNYTSRDHSMTQNITDILLNLVELIVSQFQYIEEDESYRILLPWDINQACHSLYDQYGLIFDTLDEPGVVTCTINGDIGTYTQDYVIGFLLFCDLYDNYCDINIQGVTLTSNYLLEDEAQGVNSKYTPSYFDILGQEEGEYHAVLSEQKQADYYLITIGNKTWTAETYDFFEGMVAAANYYNDKLPELYIVRAIYANNQYYYDEITL